MTDQQAQQDTEEIWICVGKRVTTKGALATFFKKPDGTESGIDFKKSTASMRYARPGQQWQVVLNADRQILVNQARLLPGLIDDRNQILAWSSEEKVAEIGVEQERTAKKATDPMMDALRPINERYRRLIMPAQRAALLSAVIEMVTR